MAKYRNIRGDEFDAVQFFSNDPRFDAAGHEVTEHEVPERNGFGPGTKTFIATKDTDGDGNIDGPLSSIAEGTWVLTDEDGNVSLCHPSVFEREYEEMG